MKDYFFVSIIFIAWIAGVVLAQGSLKLLAICVPFYSFYLVVEKAMQIAGII